MCLANSSSELLSQRIFTIDPFTCHIIVTAYRVFRHIGGVYTIIGAFFQETQARATSPNGCKPLQADKWPRLQRGATKCVFMTQTAAISKKVHVQSPLSPKRSHFGTSFYAQLSQVISLVSSSFLRFACFLVQFTVLSWGFHGVRHLTCSFPYLEAHGTNLCVPWCCTSRFCMSWRGGVKQNLGGLPNERNPLKTHIKLSVVLHIASSEKLVF